MISWPISDTFMDKSVVTHLIWSMLEFWNRALNWWICICIVLIFVIEFSQDNINAEECRLTIKFLIKVLYFLYKFHITKIFYAFQTTNRILGLCKNNVYISKSDNTLCTALHWGLSKYLTAQYTQFSPTPTKHGRPLSSHGKLLYLQSLSTIQEYKFFFCP